MDFSQPVIITSQFLGKTVSVEFPSVLDSDMIAAVKKLNDERVSVRQGQAIVDSYGPRLRFFNKMAQCITEGIDIPEAETDWKRLVPPQIKSDMVAQLENATSVVPDEEGNSDAA